MDFLQTSAAFVLVLGIIIFVHEFGHLIVAKAFGMRVFIFSFGFGKRLFGFQWGDTDCRVSLVPLGGYVKLEGEPEDHLSEDTSARGDGRDFTSRPRWQRFLVYLAGPGMNAALTISVLSVFYMIGFAVDASRFDRPIVGAVDATSPAATGRDPPRGRDHRHRRQGLHELGGGAVPHPLEPGPRPRSTGQARWRGARRGGPLGDRDPGTRGLDRRLPSGARGPGCSQAARGRGRAQDRRRDPEDRGYSHSELRGDPGSRPGIRGQAAPSQGVARGPGARRHRDPERRGVGREDRDRSEDRPQEVRRRIEAVARVAALDLGA